jgi:hypothetical protein
LKRNDFENQFVCTRAESKRHRARLKEQMANVKLI